MNNLPVFDTADNAKLQFKSNAFLNMADDGVMKSGASFDLQNSHSRHLNSVDDKQTE